MESIKTEITVRGVKIPVRISQGKIVVKFIDHTESEEVQTVESDGNILVEFFPDEVRPEENGG